MAGSFIVVGRIKPASSSDAMNLEELTRKALTAAGAKPNYQTRFYFNQRGEVSLQTQPPKLSYFGSPGPEIGAVVQLEEMLPEEGLFSQKGLLALWYKMFPPWVGVYQRV